MKVSRKSAYSLLELSIVISILAVLTTGGLTILFKSEDDEKLATTKNRIEVIYKSFGEYLLAHKALPCPASINLIKDSDINYGKIMGSAGNCQTSGVYLNEVGTQNLVYGMIPTQDLNLPSEYSQDGYGNKFTYIVAQALTNDNFASNPTIGFGRSDNEGLITINESVSSTSKLVSNDAVFLIISHGVNSNGSFAGNLPSISQLSSNSDEQSNYASSFNNTSNTANFDKTFVLQSTKSDNFDDIVFYKTRNQIVADFDLQNLIFCPDSTLENGNQTKTYSGASAIEFTWNRAQFDFFVESNDNCPQDLGADPPYNWQVKNKKPLKKCGPFGKWYNDITVNCKNS